MVEQGIPIVPVVQITMRVLGIGPIAVSIATNFLPPAIAYGMQEGIRPGRGGTW